MPPSLKPVQMSPHHGRVTALPEQPPRRVTAHGRLGRAAPPKQAKTLILLLALSPRSIGRRRSINILSLLFVVLSWGPRPPALNTMPSAKRFLAPDGRWLRLGCPGLHPARAIMRLRCDAV
ncbi:hypothetical protein BS50DRAFT_377415 [Corynespora cassiicola Philippines]|uniref:Uncharacterized protein n=1 Tax=Corynespora cassiicola Philippines TaxID=1448308 RepID=A0A2T2NN85_CORCC|nr:hypothetical protein BS50DRAFT_377415 [Corynespora cassiicola Philippines]